MAAPADRTGCWYQVVCRAGVIEWVLCASFVSLVLRLHLQHSTRHNNNMLRWIQATCGDILLCSAGDTVETFYLAGDTVETFYFAGDNCSLNSL